MILAKKSPLASAKMSPNQELIADKGDLLAKRTRTKKQPPSKVVPVESVRVLEEATGTQEPLLQERLIQQVLHTLWLPEGISENEHSLRITSAISLLQGIRPTDEIEGMLATQMVATHNAAMECLRRAMIEGQTFEGRDLALKHAAKLLSIYSRQIEVLNKHRGKGQQKITVKYVNVEAGGQAVVGNIETGKRLSKRKPPPKQSPKAIANEPGETIDMQMETKEPANLRNERDSESGGKS